MLVAYPSAHVTLPTAWTAAHVIKIAITDVPVRMKLIIVVIHVMLKMRITTSQGSIYQSFVGPRTKCSCLKNEILGSHQKLSII